jgi:hypothetical protein
MIHVNFAALLTHSTEEIENYGLTDLQELLELLSKKQRCDTSCKTTKVQKFLQVLYTNLKLI